ncbi:NUDIX hydrolase domain containing protein [Aphelenchoides fujianensis]|nr:NUDIX hydrolase domain containing protein [Aphelenchoides fujianensis]
MNSFGISWILRKMPASRLLHLVGRRAISRTASAERLDPVQVGYLNERCILVDEADNVVGHATKAECHRTETAALHRAFSVFLFTSDRRLLLQKRAATKITFPSVWTNTCCSHPLHVPEELETGSQAIGVRRAAIRKLKHELNIGGLHADQLDVVGRILYKADSDAEWMEHELDYVLIGRHFDADVRPNPDEVADVELVTPERLERMFADDRHRFSPWFSLLHRSGWLRKWWTHLDEVHEVADLERIHKLN